MVVKDYHELASFITNSVYWLATGLLNELHVRH